MHLLFVPMNRKETRLGFVWLGIFLLSVLVFPVPSNAAGEFAFRLIHFAAAVLIFHRFLRASFDVPLMPVGRILSFALLGLIAAQLANLLTNDLLFYFFPEYFRYTETGPAFVNIQKESMAGFAREQFLLSALSMILLIPVTEELFHRGLVFGTLARKSTVLAYLVSAAFYALIPTVILLGSFDPDYIILSFIQYLPIGFLFAWIYTRTETILTPIAAHMLMNAVSIFTMR